MKERSREASEASEASVAKRPVFLCAKQRSYITTFFSSSAPSDPSDSKARLAVLLHLRVAMLATLFLLIF